MSEDKTTEELGDEFTTQGDEATSMLADEYTQPPESYLIAGRDKLPVPMVRLALRVNVKKLPNYDGLPDLNIATPGSVGVDLFAANDDVLLLNSIGATVVVPTGISIEIPFGFEAQIRPRSGLAANEGLTVLNSPGTIDSDYRGEIKVILTKLTTGKFKVQRGMRIAQMVFAPVAMPNLVYVDELNDTERGEGGLGSTGK